jgi:hypothetical protein
MSIPTIKLEETTVFDNFNKHFPELKRIPREVEDSPDVVCELNGKRIGIELTRYFHSDVLKTEQSLSQKLIDSAKTKYEIKYGKSCTVHFFYRHDWKFLTLEKIRKTFDHLSDKIVEYVVAFHADENYNDHSPYFELEQYGLADVFYTITFPGKWLTKHHWDISGAAFSHMPLSDETLQELNNRISNKESDFEKYKLANNLDACWLLIYFAGDEVSDLDLQDNTEQEIQPKIERTRYSKVFLFDYMWSNRLTHLK